MAAFARKAPEARDVRALMDGDEPWASETHPRVALGAEGSLDASFKTCAYVRSDGGGDERLRLDVRAKAPGGDDASIGAAEFSRDDLVRARDPVVAPRRAGRGRLLPRATPLGPDEVPDAAARRAGTACLRQAFLLDDGRVLSEACCESAGAHEIVRDVLKPVADGATRAAAAWLARAERERVVRCAFADDDDARAHGARKAARGGARRARRDARGRGGRRRRAAGRRQGEPRAARAVGLSGSRGGCGAATSPNPLGAEDAAAPAPFVRVEVERDGARTRLGRTNTEYASVAPSFGANARAERSCPHAAPRTAFEAEEGAARLVAGSTCRRWASRRSSRPTRPRRGARARPDPARRALLRRARRRRRSYWRSCVPLPAPSAGPPAPAWVPRRPGAEVFVAVHVVALEGAAAAALPDGGDEDDLRAHGSAPPRRPRPRRPGTTAGCAATARRSRRRARGSAGSPPRPRPRRGPGGAASSRRRATRCLGDLHAIDATPARWRGDGLIAHGTNRRARLPGVGAGRRGNGAGAPRHVHGRRARRRRHAGPDGGGLLRLQRGASGGDETAAAYATRRALVLAQALQVLAQALRAKVAWLPPRVRAPAKEVCKAGAKGHGRRLPLADIDGGPRTGDARGRRRHRQRAAGRQR